MRILIVDDDEGVRYLLEKALVPLGHEIEVFESGFGVVNRVAGRGDTGAPPQLVILDHMLPGLSGGTILEMLAKDNTAARVPVILYSATDAATLQGLARTHPNCIIVPKGGRLGELLEAVRVQTEQ